jgi:hypothetical protein
MDPVALAGLIIALFGLYRAGRFAWRYLRSDDLKGQLEAKDVVIETNRQTIESFKLRIDMLEGDMNRVLANAEASAKKLEERLGSLQVSLDSAIERYRELEQYAAPEAVKRFSEQQQADFEALTARLVRIEKKIHEVDARKLG